MAAIRDPAAPDVVIQNTSFYEVQLDGDAVGSSTDVVLEPSEWHVFTPSPTEDYPFSITVDRTPMSECKFTARLVLTVLPLGSVGENLGYPEAFCRNVDENAVELRNDFQSAIAAGDITEIVEGLLNLLHQRFVVEAALEALVDIGVDSVEGGNGIEILLGIGISATTELSIEIIGELLIDGALGLIVAALGAATFGVAFIAARLADMTVIATGQKPVVIVDRETIPTPTPTSPPSPTPTEPAPTATAPVPTATPTAPSPAPTATSVPAPAPPTNVELIPLFTIQPDPLPEGDDFAVLQWSPGSGNEAGYRIYAAKTCRETELVVDYEADITEHTVRWSTFDEIDTFIPDCAYAVEIWSIGVSAYNSGGESEIVWVEVAESNF